MRDVSDSAGSDGASGAWFAVRGSAAARIGKVFFAVMVAAYFALCFSANGSFLNLQEYTRGEAATPYQYRVLPMFVFRAAMGIPALVAAARHVEAMHDDPYRLIMAGIAFVAMLGAMYATQLTIARLTGDRVYAFWASFSVAYMALLLLASSFGLSYTLPYDVPALFFFALSMYLIVSGRRWWFLVLFPLAVLNRETACFITVFYAVWEWVRLAKEGAGTGERLRRIAPAVLLQMVVWFAIKLYLVRVFGHNATERNSHVGGLFATNLGFNLREIVKPQQWPILLSVCGFSLPFLYLQRRWIRCDGMYWACAIILPLYLAGMMMVGVIVELRIFTEWIALVVPSLALIVHNRFRPVAD